MRAIFKRSEPRALLEYKAQANADWTPTYEELEGKAAVRKALLDEQHGLCAYCMGRIGKPGRDDCHIDHVRPQSRFKELALEYENMVASCQGRPSKDLRAAPEHCGAARGDWFDEDLFVTPRWPDCARFFRFRESGEIEATDDDTPVRPSSAVGRRRAAGETIAHLELNARLLQQHRKGAIDEVLSELETAEEPPSRKTIEERIAQYGSIGKDGRLTPYCVAIVRVLERELARART